MSASDEPDTAALIRLIRDAPPRDVQERSVPDGWYVRWTAGPLRDVWLHLAPDGRPLGHRVHVGGAARLRARLEARLPGPPSDALAGGFLARPVDPATLRPDGPQFGFDCPDARVHDALALPADVDLQLAGIVHDVRPAGSPQSPTPGSDPLTRSLPEDAEVTLGGHLVRADRLAGPAGNGSRWWVLLAIPGGAVDLLLPRDVARPPETGQSLTVACSLSGRIHPVDPSRSRGLNPRAAEPDEPASPLTIRVRGLTDPGSPEPQ